MQNWKEQMSKLRLIITGSYSLLQVSITFEGFLKVYLEGHDDDEEEQEGMLR
jgi:hypothetical protein